MVPVFPGDPPHSKLTDSGHDVTGTGLVANGNVPDKLANDDSNICYGPDGLIIANGHVPNGHVANGHVPNGNLGNKKDN